MPNIARKDISVVIETPTTTDPPTTTLSTEEKQILVSYWYNALRSINSN